MGISGQLGGNFLIPFSNVVAIRWFYILLRILQSEQRKMVNYLTHTGAADSPGMKGQELRGGLGWVSERVRVGKG